MRARQVAAIVDPLLRGARRLASRVLHENVVEARQVAVGAGVRAVADAVEHEPKLVSIGTSGPAVRARHRMPRWRSRSTRRCPGPTSLCHDRQKSLCPRQADC